MLLFMILVGLLQLPPDPESLPRSVDRRMVLARPMPRDASPANYLAFLQTRPADRRARFARLPPEERSSIMRHHLSHVLRNYRPTSEEAMALVKTSNAATSAAYSGDATARKQLDDAERHMMRTLSAPVLAAVRELLTPPAAKSHR
jgi:hypothetical protein